MERFRKSYSILFVIFITTIFLRVFRLSESSLWLDEVLNVNWAKLPTVTEIIKFLSTNDNSPPFFYIFLHYWIKLFGTSEFVLRLPSAISGVIVVFLVYKIASYILDTTAGFFCLFFERYRRRYGI